MLFNILKYCFLILILSLGLGQNAQAQGYLWKLTWHLKLNFAGQDNTYVLTTYHQGEESYSDTFLSGNFGRPEGKFIALDRGQMARNGSFQLYESENLWKGKLIPLDEPLKFQVEGEVKHLGTIPFRAPFTGDVQVERESLRPPSQDILILDLDSPSID